MTLSDLPPWFATGLAIALGLLFGSFLNVVIYRLPRDESLSFPGSHCPSCGAPIRAFDNVPVLGWLALRGRARCCGAAISPRYPLVETIGGLLGWAVLELLRAELPAETALFRTALCFALYLALGLGLIAAAFIDLSHMYLPDSITLGGAALGLLSSPLRPGITLQESVIGGIVGFLIVWLPFDRLHRFFRGTPGMGLGDAKLVLLAGTWFGYQGALFALFGGALQATLMVLVLFVFRIEIREPEAVGRERAELAAELAATPPEERAELERELGADPLALAAEPGFGKQRIAFGPFLVLAILEFLLFGNWLESQFVAFLNGT